MQHVTSGGYNTALGFKSLNRVTTGESNTAMGYKSLEKRTYNGYNMNRTTHYNTEFKQFDNIGYQALRIDTDDNGSSPGNGNAGNSIGTYGKIIILLVLIIYQ